MLRIINIVLACSVVVLAVWMYELKYGVRGSVTEQARIKRQIEKTKQDITLLKAEWSHLTRPKRLQALAKRHLKLERVQPRHIVREGELALLPERPQPEPPHEGGDPIAGLLGTDGPGNDDPIAGLLEGDQ